MGEDRAARAAAVTGESPTGNRIAFVSERDGNFEIYVMKPDGSLQTRVTNDAGWNADPAWAITVTR